MTQQHKNAPNAGPAPVNPAERAKPRSPRTTKSVQLTKMLETKRGADVTAIGAKFGWQPHTVRAALSGLRKAGLNLVREGQVARKPSRYRIVRDGTAVAELGAGDEG